MSCNGGVRSQLTLFAEVLSSAKTPRWNKTSVGDMIASVEHESTKDQPGFKAFSKFNQVMAEQQYREFWMPDRLCKTCYECEAPFTVFRRKHHCRVCGQVFCHNCTNFIDGKIMCVRGMVRTCKACYSQFLSEIQSSSQTSCQPTDDCGSPGAISFNEHSRDVRTALAVGSTIEEPGYTATYDATSLASLQSMGYHAEGANDERFRRDQIEIDKISEPFFTFAVVTALIGRRRLLEPRHRHSTLPQHARTFERNTLQYHPSAGSMQILARNREDEADGFGLGARSLYTVSGAVDKFLPANLSDDAGQPHTRRSMQGLLDSACDICRHRDNLAATAAQHLLRIIHELVSESLQCAANGKEASAKWSRIIFGLTRKACSHVKPSLFGNEMDVRPYVTIKAIPGGCVEESRFVDGLVFRKNVVHGRMNRTYDGPTIMLIAGGLEFQRTHSRLACIGTLFEQEEKHSEIMVGKITRLKPTILFVGCSVSRGALEFLLQHQITVFQRVELKLMERISRVTGATILSSIDQVSRIGDNGTLGYCHKMQMFIYNSNLETWYQRTDVLFLGHSPRSLDVNLNSLPHITRRGFVNYVYLHGCPEERCGTIILRGSTHATLAKLKEIVRFSVFVAYHLRLEAAFFHDCGAVVSQRDAQVNLKQCRNSSHFALLAPDYGLTWASHIQRNQPFCCAVTQFSQHQSLLVTCICMNRREQFVPPEVKAIVYYSMQDWGLRDFLQRNCPSTDISSPLADRSVSPDLTQLFYHCDGCVSFAVAKRDDISPDLQEILNSTDCVDCVNRPLYIWNFCHKCSSAVKLPRLLSDDAANLSFGKFLEIMFYNSSAICHKRQCSHAIQHHHVLNFCWGNLIVQVEYKRVEPYEVHLRQGLALDRSFHSGIVGSNFQELRRTSQHLRHLFESKLAHLGCLLNSIRSSDPYLMRIMVKANVEKTCNLSLALTTECARLAQQMRAYFWKFSQQLVDCACINCKHPLASVNILLDSRQELYLRGRSWNEQLHIMGCLLTSLRDRFCSCSIDARLLGEASELVSYEMRRLHHIKDVFEFQVVTGPDEFVEEDYTEVPIDNLDNLGRIPEVRISQVEAQHPTLLEGRFQLAQLCDHMTTRFDFSASSSSHSTRRKLKGHGTTGGSWRAAKMGPLEQAHYDAHHDFGVDNGGNVSFAHGLTDIEETRHSSVEKASEASLWPDQALVSLCAKRPNKLTNAFARFMGKDDPEEDPWSVQLDLVGGRFRLTVGEDADVLPVDQEQPTTLVAYSLTTVEYRKLIGTHLHEPPASALPSGRVNTIVSENGTSIAVCASHPSSANSHIPTAGSTCVYIGATERNGTVHTAVRDSQLRPVSCTSFSRENDELNNASQLDNRSQRLSLPSKAKDEDTILSQHNTTYNGLHSAFPMVSFDILPHFCEICQIENKLLSTHKLHIKQSFLDVDEHGSHLCRYVCRTFWAAQFSAVRQAYIGSNEEEESGYIRSLSMARPWNAQGGKSGATFLKTADGRFVVKHVTRTELQMFLDYAPAYFEYLSKTFFHGHTTMLVKVLGVYQIGSYNSISGKRIMDHVVVMENLFYKQVISRAFDLKGSTRSRYTRVSFSNQDEAMNFVRSGLPDETPLQREHQVLLDENFLEYSQGNPLPLRDQAKVYFNKAVFNDTLFLSLINVVDYSILVGINERNRQLTVGIIDYMRQYDMLKKVERMSKSVGMIAGQAEPTVIQPPNYRNRFQAAMTRYFMMVPDKWTPYWLKHTPV